jgi:hypothetical protein
MVRWCSATSYHLTEADREMLDAPHEIGFVHEVCYNYECTDNDLQKKPNWGQ